MWVKIKRIFLKWCFNWRRKNNFKKWINKIRIVYKREAEWRR
jgi:hypothetical protein